MKKYAVSVTSQIVGTKDALIMGSSLEIHSEKELDEFIKELINNYALENAVVGTGKDSADFDLLPKQDKELVILTNTTSITDITEGIETFIYITRYDDMSPDVRNLLRIVKNSYDNDKEII